MSRYCGAHVCTRGYVFSIYIEYIYILWIQVVDLGFLAFIVITSITCTVITGIYVPCTFDAGEGRTISVANSTGEG